MNLIFISLILIFVIIALIFFRYKLKLNYWRRKNVKVLSYIEFVKSVRKRQLGLVCGDVYQKIYDEKIPYTVLETPLQSVFIIQDPDIIKDIAITNFECFADRGLYINHRDPISTNLFRLKYDLWKPLRQKLTPAFTAAKMKFMFPTLFKVGQQFVELLREKCDNGENIMEIKDLCARFTTDVIGNVIFGIDCNSLRDPNTEFRQQAQQIFVTNLTPLMDNMGYKYPKLFEFLNIKVHSKEKIKFFTQVVKKTMEYREKNHVKQNDLMDILLELKNNDQEDNDKFKLNLEMIIGQVYGFFVAGFDTTSSTISYALYELAKQPELQDKARKSVEEAMKETSNVIDYDNLQNMSYLKQVIQETLRKYPLAPIVSRICRKQCTLRTPIHTLTVDPGTLIIVPIYGIQHNPDFYTDPECFKPERFNENEIAKRPTLSYIPFGVGPKMCIGERFGRMQAMLGLALLLSKFKFSVTEKTPKELEFNPKNLFGISVKDGIYLKVEKL